MPFEMKRAARTGRSLHEPCPLARLRRGFRPSPFEAPKEKSLDVAARVAAARRRQSERYKHLPNIRTNAQIDGQFLEQLAAPDSSGLQLLREAADAMNLSARGYRRVLRVARTLADLDGRDQVSQIDIAEALSYRQRLAAFHAAAYPSPKPARRAASANLPPIPLTSAASMPGL